MLRVAALQVRVSSNRQNLHQRIAGLVKEAASRGARLAVLPESFNGVYDVDNFEANGEIWKNKNSGSKLMSKLAAEHKIIVVGGVIERHPINKNLYSTIAAFDINGLELARYRKMHLHKGIDESGKNESDLLVPGEELSWFDVPDNDHPDSDGRGWRVGIACGLDLRFPEVASLYCNIPPMGLGSELLLFPSASTRFDGWKSLLKARALDSQCYVMGVQQLNDGFDCKGSTVIGPAGKTLSESTDCKNDQVVVADLCLRSLIETRKNDPLKSIRRSHVYGDAIRRVHSNPMAMMRRGPTV